MDGRVCLTNLWTVIRNAPVGGLSTGPRYELVCLLPLVANDKEFIGERTPSLDPPESGVLDGDSEDPAR